MRTDDFNYELPQELIAQIPPAERTDSRMMVLNRTDRSIENSGVLSLPSFLNEGDLMVFNNTKVFPARTRGVREDTGGKVELVFVQELEPEQESSGSFSSCWLCIFGSGSKTREGQSLVLCGGRLKAKISEVRDQGHIVAAICTEEPVMDVLAKHGEIPLPPYIARDSCDVRSERDRERYQTVYASQLGAVAAPTAGLHFTDSLFAELAEKGVNRCEVTLHVGPGTFLPVKVEDVETHVMHSERYAVSRESADAINETRNAGGRIIAVGTTTVRTLEGLFDANGCIEEASGHTDIFIYPPFRFNVVGAILTNFHLPRSTLLMMISAFAGHDYILEAYENAVSEGYRFYSYGDCMLIL